jgi:transcriptional regulator with XRE-family HTH domain
MTQVETWKNVGNKIRHLRKVNQLTIRQLANGCDLSANAISLVERGEVAPSVATLCKIARALGVSASSLFQEVCTPDVVLSRAGGTEPELGGEQSLEGLSCALRLAAWAAPAERSKAVKDALCMPAEGVRQSVLCLCGYVILEVDDQSFCLEPGDQLSFNGQVLHRMRNTGGSTGVAILILPAENMAIRNTGD